MSILLVEDELRNCDSDQDETLVLANDTRLLDDEHSSSSSIEETLKSIIGEPEIVSDILSQDQQISERMGQFKEFFRNILEKMDDMEERIKQLTEEKNSLTNNLEKLSNDFKIKTVSYQKNIYDQECRIIKNEQYSRRECVIITGIPETILHNHLEENVLYVLREMGLKNIRHFDIVACHRLLKSRNSRFPQKTIVKFLNRKDADFCIKNRNRIVEIKDHIGMNLRIYESLCAANEKVLMDCNNLKHVGFIHDFYIRNGFIKIIINQGDTPKKIDHINILKETFTTFYQRNATQR